MLRLRRGRPLLLVVAALVVVALSAAGVALVSAAPVRHAHTSAVATPTVSGPVTGGQGKPTLVSTNFDLASVGYVASEYFVSGTATAYAPSGTLGPDGRWMAHAAGTAPYKTRIVVYRPAKKTGFDGTVFVEWLNVSAGFDSAPDWSAAHLELIRSGAAWIGVSAQSVGVQGGAATVANVAAGGLKGNDPARYGSLTHPGDDYSYDIFSQAGLAAAGKTATRPLGDLDVQRVIGIGESQSAFRLVTYIDAVHPLARVYDGFLVHSRGATGTALSPPIPGAPRQPMPSTAAIRTDLDVPVLDLQTETDLTGLGYLPATQPDAKRFRLWEVAGTAHADSYTAGLAFDDLGDGKVERALLDPAALSGGPLGCSQPINAGPAFAVLDAAAYHLERWVRGGGAPPHAPRLDATGGPPAAIVRDEHGNARGGIRTPLVDAPTAAVTGEPNAGGAFCSLFGRTTPFDAATLRALYPTHAAYVKRFDNATERAVKAGFVLKPEARSFKAAAAASSIGG